MEHYELVQEMGAVERMSTQERLKHARKRRAQQLKKWTQYDRHLDKENTKKKKNQDKQLPPPKRTKKSNRGNVRFAHNIALLEAAARNDLNEVKILLESGVSPDVTNEDGLTALHQCCIDNSEEMMKLLLDYSANVSACDSEMWTPLHAAATCGHMMLCKYLIDRGAELLAVNADGNMPYDICEDEVTLDHIETEMAKRGITQEQIDVTRLATEHKMLDDIKDIANAGGDLEMLDHMGATWLHIAAANGYVEVAEFLLDNHVCVDTADNESWQPIHAASYWAQERAKDQPLFPSAIQSNCTSEMESTVKHQSSAPKIVPVGDRVTNMEQEILEMLVESGADLDAKTKNGETPFDLCEDPDLKQKILDMKDEIETKRTIRQQRLGSQRRQQRVSSRNLGLSSDSLYSSNTSLNLKTSVSASMRRSSMRGDKSQLFKKEHKEEALHFGLSLMSEDDSLMEAEEEQDTVPSTDLDQVTIMVTSEDDHSQPPFPPAPEPVIDRHDGEHLPPVTPPAPPAAVTTITIGAGPTVSPPPQDPSSASSHTAQSQTSVPRDSQRPPPHPSSQGRSRAPSSDIGPKPLAPTQNAVGESGPTPKAAAQNASGEAGPVPRAMTQNASGARSTHIPQVGPRQPGFSAPSHERRLSGSTLSDLKRQRSNSRESLLDLAVQNMFLESVQGGRQGGGVQGGRQGGGVPGNSAMWGREKTKNGHHNNNNAMHYSASDGQLRRFVAPTSAPAVGGEEEKQKCCVIL